MSEYVCVRSDTIFIGLTYQRDILSPFLDTRLDTQVSRVFLIHLTPIIKTTFKGLISMTQVFFVICDPNRMVLLLTKELFIYLSSISWDQQLPYGSTILGWLLLIILLLILSDNCITFTIYTRCCFFFLLINVMLNCF